MRPQAALNRGASVTIPASEDFDIEGPWGSVPPERINYDTLSREEVTIVRVCATVLALTIFACKWAVPPNIEVPFFANVGFVGWLFYRGYATISPLRAVTFAAVMVLAIAVTLFSPNEPDFSVTSLLYLVGVHAPMVFVCRIRRIVYLNILKWLALWCLVIGCFVWFQWVQQLLGFRMLNMHDYAPKSWMFLNYNYIQKVNFYSKYYKPNGFFMMETSNAAQICALGMIVELCLLRRLVRFGLLAMMMISTFGGTGIFMVLVCVPFIIPYLRARILLGILVAIPLVFAVATGLGATQSIMSRSGEFTEAGSSGHGRFVRPWIITADTLSDGYRNAAFGIGAGVHNPRMVYKSTDELWPASKILTEYGIVVGLLFLLWFHAIVFSVSAPLVLTIAALLQYDAVGGGLMVPIQTYLVMLISGLFVTRIRTSPRPSIPAGLERPRWTPRRGHALA